MTAPRTSPAVPPAALPAGPAAAPPALPAPPLAPFCAAIRSKKTYFLGRPPNTEAELLDASGACWCARTMQAIGPDGGLVDPDDCRAGRACHEPVL